MLGVFLADDPGLDLLGNQAMIAGDLARSGRHGPDRPGCRRRLPGTPGCPPRSPRRSCCPCRTSRGLRAASSRSPGWPARSPPAAPPTDRRPAGSARAGAPRSPSCWRTSPARWPPIPSATTSTRPPSSVSNVTNASSLWSRRFPTSVTEPTWRFVSAIAPHARCWCGSHLSGLSGPAGRASTVRGRSLAAEAASEAGSALGSAIAGHGEQDHEACPAVVGNSAAIVPPCSSTIWRLM